METQVIKVSIKEIVQKPKAILSKLINCVEFYSPRGTVLVSTELDLICKNR